MHLSLKSRALKFYLTTVGQKSSQTVKVLVTTHNKGLCNAEEESSLWGAQLGLPVAKSYLSWTITVSTTKFPLHITDINLLFFSDKMFINQVWMYSASSPFLLQGGRKISADPLHSWLLWGEDAERPIIVSRKQNQRLSYRVSMQLGSCHRQIRILKWADSNVCRYVNAVDCGTVQRCLRELKWIIWGPEPQ